MGSEPVPLTSAHPRSPHHRPRARHPRDLAVRRRVTLGPRRSRGAQRPRRHDSPTWRTRRTMASIPCVVIATARPDGGVSPLADVAPEAGVASLDDLVAGVGADPIAATALALLLRQGPLALGPALVAESATFSLLQSGPEFARWRAGRTDRPSAPDDEAAVLLERDRGELTIVLNRPKVKNALNRAMRDGMLEGLALAGADPSITHVTLKGSGSSFSSGGDLGEFGSFADPATAHLIRLATSIGRAIDALGSKVVAHVHGPCAGSGVELAAFVSAGGGRRRLLGPTARGRTRSGSRCRGDLQRHEAHRPPSHRPLGPKQRPHRRLDGAELGLSR